MQKEFLNQTIINHNKELNVFINDDNTNSNDLLPSKVNKHKEDLNLSLLHRASCYLTKGFYNKAIQDSSRVLEIDPNNDNAKTFICLSLLEMKQIDTAQQYLPSNHSLHSFYEAKKRELTLLQLQYPSNYHKYILFTKTLYMHDAYFPKIEIDYSTETNRRVIAKASISKSEIIMSIPKDCLITLDLAFSTVIGKELSLFMYKELNSPKHCLLASFLLTEASNPKWAFYFNILPTSFNHFPMYYTDSEMKLLENTAFIKLIEEKRREMRIDYDKIISLIPSYAQYTYDQFCKARLIVSSRLFGICMNDKKTDVLAPYADLLNHKKAEQTHWCFEERTQSFIIQAKRDIDKGEELYDSYGSKSNSRFLMHYGFALEDNDFNEYPLAISFDVNSPMYKEKEAWIKGVFEYEKTFVVNKNIANSKVTDMFSFLRFVCYKGNMQLLYTAINRGQDMPLIEHIVPTFYYIQPLSVENERDVLNALKERCVSELGKYPTTINEDEELLSLMKRKSGLNCNERNCIIMRLSEKKVLRFYADMCEYCLGLLGVSEKELINKILVDSRYEEYEYYIRDVIWVLAKRLEKSNKANNNTHHHHSDNA